MKVRLGAGAMLEMFMASSTKHLFLNKHKLCIHNARARFLVSDHSVYKKDEKIREKHNFKPSCNFHA